MSDFRKMRWTSKGSDLLLKTQGGTKLVLKEILLGAGTWPDEYQTSGAPDELVDVRRRVAVTKVEQQGTKVVVSGLANNDDLDVGFSVLELGVIAEHPDFGDILYMADCAPLEKSSYIHDKTGTPLEVPLRVEVVVSTNAEAVGFIIEDRFVSATFEDIKEHNTDPNAHPNLFDNMAAPQPTMLAPANGVDDIGATPLLRCLPHSSELKSPTHYATTWLVTEAADTKFLNPLHDSGPLTTALTMYELPGGIVTESKQYRSACIHHVSGGLISIRAEATLWTTRDEFTYVKRSTMLTPADGATNVYEQPTLTQSAFAVVGGNDTHAADQYRALNAEGVVIWTSGELPPGVPYKLIAGLIKVKRGYSFEGRQKGTALGWSEWSVGVNITTAHAFVTADEAAFVGSTWLEYAQASAAGVALDHGAVLRSNPVLQGAGEGNWVAFSVRVVVRGTGLKLLSGTKADELETPDYIAVNDTVLTEHGSGVVESVAETDTSGVVDFFGDGSGVDVWNFNDSLISQENRNIIQAAGLVGYEDMKIGKGVVLNDSLATSFSPFQTAANNLFSFSWFMPNIVDANSSVNYMTDSQGDHMSYARVNYSTVDWVTRFSGSSINIPRPDPAEFPFLHLALIITNNKVSRYINGSLIGEAVVDFTSQTVRIMGPESNTGSRNLRMDQLRWFNRALTVEEIGQLMQETGIIRRATIPALSGVPSRAHILPKLAIATGAADATFVEGDYAAVAIESATLVTDDDPTNPQAVVIDTAKVTPAAFRQIAIQVEPPEGSETRANEVVINLDKEGS